MAEGFSLGAYRFTKYRSDPKPNRIRSVTVVGGGGQRARAALERGARIAEAVGVARDLVNEPGGSLTPPAFADDIRSAGEASRASTCKVLTENAITKAGYARLARGESRARRIRPGGSS